MMAATRRIAVGAVATALIAGLAGCSGSDGRLRTRAPPDARRGAARSRPRARSGSSATAPPRTPGQPDLPKPSA